jgi:predicted nucleotidyltransferase
MISKDRFDQEIQNIVERLIRVYKPEKIILFGSLVRGKMKEGTDIDFFIIKKDVPELDY